MKPILAVDICNTIADINGTLLGFMPGLNVTKYPIPGITNKTFEENPWIFTKAKPIEGAIEGLNYLANHWHIIYLTARPKWAIGITKRWLEKHGFPMAEVISSDNKAGEIKKRGIAVAIDDAPKEIITMRKLIPVYIHRKIYNEDIAGIKFSWDEDWQDKITLPANHNIKPVSIWA